MDLPTTLWTQVLEAGQGAPDALDALVTRYLEPVYAFVRVSGHPRQDAEDLAHEFFVHVLESATLARADPQRGRFRGFLVTCLTHFLADHTAKRRALKRGGGKQHVPLDVEAIERSLQSPHAESDPVRMFHRRYAQATLDRALQRLHSQLSPSASQVFGLAYGQAPVPQTEIATRAGMTEEAVAASVYRSRRKLRKLLLAEVRDTVASEAEAKLELEALFEALG